MEEAELNQIRRNLAEERKRIRTEYPFNNWSSFLQYKAVNGDKSALNILRFKDKNYTLYEDRRLQELEVE
jgi:hypothetical protein